MRWLTMLTGFALPSCLLALLGTGCATGRGTPAVVKVLPHYLDPQGRVALAPSLFDRDAYQSQLRRNPGQRSALRFDVQWRAPRQSGLTLQMEVRGVASNRVTTARLQAPLPPAGRLSRWSGLVLDGAGYRELGDLTAWRASLWQGTNLLAEQHSFLW